MRTESKSPICLRIDAVTQKVEAALKDIPALRKIIKK